MRPAGLHHVTLVCTDAARTLAFYTEVLGLRVLKRSVNYHDPEVARGLRPLPGAAAGG